MAVMRDILHVARDGDADEHHGPGFSALWKADVGNVHGPLSLPSSSSLAWLEQVPTLGCAFQGGQRGEHQQDPGAVAVCLLWGDFPFPAQEAGALLPILLPSSSLWAGGCCQLPRLACFSWSCAEAYPPAWGPPVLAWPAHRRWAMAKLLLLKGLRLLFSLALAREEEAEGL